MISGFLNTQGHWPKKQSYKMLTLFNKITNTKELRLLMKTYRRTSELIHGKDGTHDVSDGVSTQYVIVMIILLIKVINKGS